MLDVVFQRRHSTAVAAEPVNSDVPAYADPLILYREGCPSLDSGVQFATPSTAVFTNDGSGGFIRADYSSRFGSTGLADPQAIADLNGDGYGDLILQHQPPAGSTLYAVLNSGAPGTTPSQPRFPSSNEIVLATGLRTTSSAAFAYATHHFPYALLSSVPLHRAA